LTLTTKSKNHVTIHYRGHASLLPDTTGPPAGPHVTEVCKICLEEQEEEEERFVARHDARQGVQEDEDNINNSFAIFCGGWLCLPSRIWRMKYFAKSIARPTCARQKSDVVICPACWSKRYCNEVTTNFGESEGRD